MPQNGNDANAENVLYARRGCGEGKGGVRSSLCLCFVFANFGRVM